ncbi:MAG TPA: hypothetical protein VNE63_16690 [Candidatus Acidoferrales bacterium]|nr:hypothetical protein [Candidatus Acidoferrales bacterium]
MYGQESLNKGVAGTSDSHDSLDEIAISANKGIIDNHISRWLAKDLKMLADAFLYESPADIKNISLHEDELLLCIELPFRNPLPSGEEGDRLAKQEDIDAIRIGFVTFLTEQTSVRRRLANFFYSEFRKFLQSHAKHFRFSDAILAEIERSGERRLSGRPSLPIPDRAKEDVKRIVTSIYEVLPDIQRKIKYWKQENGNITQQIILQQLKLAYDREQYPWSRYAFQNTNNTILLPGKRAYRSDRSKHEKDRESGGPGFAEPERWSTPAVAAPSVGAQHRKHDDALCSFIRR